MKLPLLLPCMVFAAQTVTNAQQAPYSDPQNSGGWVLNESVSDEFDGDSLDLEKWKVLGADGNYYGRWKGRAPSQFTAANVKVEGGNLTITSKWEPDFEFVDEKFKNGYKYGEPAPITTGCIISNAKFKYGYMEMRCKAADGPVSSSFWTTGEGGEIDVFEHYGNNPDKSGHDRRYHSSFHDWRKGSPTIGTRIWTNDHQLDFRVADDFHVYGMEWAPDYVKIYVDGRLVNCVTREEMGDKWVATHEQMIWIDSETFEWELKAEKMQESDFGDGREFIVDYCRIWGGKGDSAGCETRANLLANPSFEAGTESWEGIAEITDLSKSGDSASLLKKGATIEQTVSVKPNTTYILSAWAKSPETEHKNLWLKGRLGVKEYGGEDMHTRMFFPYFHEKSIQFKTGADTTTAVVYFSNENYGKDIIVDDFELVEAPSPSELAKE